jgi:uncharacterized protein (DUF1697 family)
MTTWVLLLRGINVGGNNRHPMRDLAALLECLVLRDVRTSIQSGNVVFAERAERLVGVPAAARNWTTVRKPAELAGV